MPRIDDILAAGSAVSKLDLRRYLSAREVVTPTDYGGVEGGVVDCAPAFAAALAANKAVFVPPGVWRIAAPIVLGYGQSLFGIGDGSVIQAREAPWDGNALPAYPSQFEAIELRDGYCHVHDLKLVGGASAVKLYGRTGPCVRNVIENLTIWDALIGLTLDGYDNSDRPTYWNHFARILIARPGLHGVLMTVESTGDTPNANKFHDVRVYSLSAPLTGCGFFLSTARFHNSFIDCEANVSPTAEACFRLGALTDQTRIINFYAECSGAVPGIRIDRSSQNTTIINLFSATGGAPIWDTSGARAYTALNAGYPTKTLLHDVLATDLRVEGFAAETAYAEPVSGGLVQPDLTKSSVWLISAFGGLVEVRLPHAAEANGRRVTIKKTDLSLNPVTVTETSGPGPDGRAVLLGSRYDHVEVVSNGAGWWIVAGNIVPGNVRFFDGVTGVIALDLGQNFYAISAQAGVVEARLPAPGDAQAAGRRITIKKTDASANAVTVTCVSGGGPDGRPAVLRYQYDSLDVVSNGAAWFIAALVANYGDVEYIEGVSPITGKAGRSLYTVSAYTGVTEFRLPDPSLPTAVGKPMTIKKADQTSHAVWVTAEVGNGPEGRRVILSAQGDYVTVVSDGAGWHTIGASTPTVGAAYIEGTAGFWVDTARPLCLVSAWTGQATATLPAPGSPEGWGRQVTIKKVDSSNNPVLVVADGSAGPDGAMVVLGKFGDFVSVISNGAQWYIASRCYDTPITGWASPDGGGFNRGVYNTDEISNVGWEYSRDVVNAINYRLLATRDVLRALILDLKMKGIIGD